MPRDDPWLARIKGLGEADRFADDVTERDKCGTICEEILSAIER